MKSESIVPETQFSVYLSENGDENEQQSVEDMDISQDNKHAVCQFDNIKISHKVEFLVENQKLVCCRDILSKSSPLFAAMLHGQFLEANQNEVLIEDTTFYAFQYLIHYIHKCCLQCDIINHLMVCEPTSENVNNCLEVLSLAIKYMVNGLQSFLISVMSRNLMSSATASHVFHFALLHDYVDLADDSVICVTKRGDNLERMKGICKFLKGENLEAFLITIKELLTC